MSQVAQPKHASEFSMPPELAELMRQMLDLDASDLHITAGISPQVRVDGKLQGMDYAPLDVHATQSLLYSVMTDEQKSKFEESLECDFSFGMQGLSLIHI